MSDGRSPAFSGVTAMPPDTPADADGDIHAELSFPEDAGGGGIALPPVVPEEQPPDEEIQGLREPHGLDGATLVQFVLGRAWVNLSRPYAGSGLGAFWLVLHPLAWIGVYSMVFGVVLSRSFEGLGVPYPIFLCAGLLPWLGFSDTLGRGTNAYSQNSAFLKKLAVPESLFVIEQAITATMRMFIGFGAFLLVVWLWGLPAAWTWLLLPLPLLLLQALGMGLAMCLAPLRVLFPDIGELVPVALRLMFWAIPVLFPLSFYTEHGLGWLATANPVSGPLVITRDLLIDHAISPWPWWAWASVTALVLVAIGWAISHRLGEEVRDQL